MNCAFTKKLLILAFLLSVLQLGFVWGQSSAEFEKKYDGLTVSNDTRSMMIGYPAFRIY